MKSLKTILAAAAIAIAIPFSALSDDAAKKPAEKQWKRKGTLVCAKCSLGKTDSCQAALKINRKNKAGEKVEKVFLLKNNDVAKAFHKNICSGDEVPVAITGKREGKGKNVTIAATKIEKVTKKAKKKA